MKTWPSGKVLTVCLWLAAMVFGCFFCPRGFICTASASAGAIQQDRRPQRNAFSEKTNRTVERAGFSFQLPSCWEEEYPDYFYAETGGKSAFLMLTETDFPLEYLQFLHIPSRILGDINEGMKPDSYTVLDISSVNGFPAACETVEGRVQAMGAGYLRYRGYVVILFDIENMQSVVMGLMISENTDFRYDDDFWKTMLSVVCKEDSDSQASGTGRIPGRTEYFWREFRHLAQIWSTSDEPVRSAVKPVIRAYFAKLQYKKQVTAGLITGK